MDAQTAGYRVWKHADGAPARRVDDTIAIEEPLEIRIAGRPISVTMRTPGHDRELVAGFLAGEGVVRHPGQVRHIRLCDREDGALADVTLAPDAVVDLARLTRHVFASSSCGACGAATIEAVRRSCDPLAPPGSTPGPLIDTTTLASLPARLRDSQPAFSATGGVHGAALFDNTGLMLAASEDVGRHNAVDKLLGRMFLEDRWPLSGHVLMVSGRVSFEIVQKALVAGVPFIAAVSAPTSLAIDLADASNMTLVGFLRPGGCNVYTHPGRILASD